MNQRPQIGSEYDGPCFDRPCLRQLPEHWQLDLPQPTFRDWLQQAIGTLVSALVHTKVH